MSSTVWKLQNFTVNQILREIKLGKARDSKSAFLPKLEVMNFHFYAFLYFLKSEFLPNQQNSESLKWHKWQF